MTQYKQMASEGSFNAIEVPNQTVKIKEQTAKKLRAKLEAHEYNQRNQQIYLQAQQYAQQEEELSREENDRLETKNRQAFIDATNRDYNTQLKNAEIKNNQRAQNFKALSDFSETALTTIGEYNKKQEEDKRDAANVAASTHGFVASDIKQIQLLKNNLSYSQFAATEFIKKFDNGNASEEKKQALYSVYNSKGSKAWLENTSIVNNTSFQYETGLDAELAEHPDATPDEKEGIISQYKATFISQIRGDKGEIFSPKALIPLFNHISTVNGRYLASNNKERIKLRKGEIKLTQYKELNTAFVSDKISGVLRWNSINPSAERRETMMDWAINASKGNGPGALGVEDLAGLLTAKYELADGSMTSIGEAYTGTDGVAKINDQIRLLNNRERTANTNAEADRLYNIENEITLLAQQAAKDGIVSKNEVDRARLLLDEAGPGVQSKAFDALKAMSIDVRAREITDTKLNELYIDGNLTLERLKAFELPPELESKWGSRASALSTHKKSPTYGNIKEEITRTLSEHPQIKVAPDGIKNSSVIGMTKEFVQMYNQKVQKYLSQTTPDEASSIARGEVITRIKELQETVGYINSENGRYNAYDANVAAEAKQAQIMIEKINALNTLALKPASQITPKAIGNIIGEENYMEMYKDLSIPGAVPSEMLKQLSEELGRDPLTVMNFVAPAFGQEKIELEDNTFEGIKKNLPPKYTTLFDYARTNQRVIRANTVMEGRTSQAPLRQVQIPDNVKADTHFMNGIKNIAAKYKIKENDLLRIISFETGGTFNPAQRNGAGSGATGLIQFMPSTAQGLGTTTAALAKMSRTEQLQYVDKYLSTKGIEGGSYNDLYMAVLFPAAVGKSDDFVLFGDGATTSGYGAGSNAYWQNSGLDTNKDGKVTKSEAAETSK